MTPQLKKLMICLTVFLLLSCSTPSRKVIWRDYRKNKTNETIKIGLAKDFYGKIHKVKLTANKTKSFSANQDDFIISQEAAADSFSYCFQYPVAFLMTCDLEVFLFDDFEITKTEDGYKLNPQDDVLAYYVNDFDEHEKTNYIYISKDSNIEIKRKIEVSKIENILNEIENGDCYYESTLTKNPEQEIHDFGYIVMSKTLNKPIWVTVHEL